MPAVDREVSRDRESDLSLKRQYSFTDNARPHVPMWDSSDPDRAPPPLPLNPSSPSATTRPNASATVIAAAAALTEKARESAGPSPYTTNPMPSKRDASPEKSLLRGHHHKRMQSIQASSTRDIAHLLEAGPSRSLESSPERPLIRSGNVSSLGRDYGRDYESSSPEKSPTKANTPIPYIKDTGRLSSIRSSARQPARSILGENAPPPSATMLALQTMSTPADPPEPTPNMTNGSSALVRSPQTYEVLSSQILSLTSIATNLQREMAQLSRRSKDNATDLISLKEATNARDEDIRQSLRELVTNLSTRLAESAEAVNNNLQVNSGNPSFLLDNKPHASPPAARSGRGYVLPRIPSPNSFSATLERELANSPSPFGMESAASLALLEKILREMGTKEGQERLFASITQVLEKTNKDDGGMAKRMDELFKLIKDTTVTRAVTTQDGAALPSKDATDIDPAKSGPLVRARKELAQRQEDAETKKPILNSKPIDLSGDEMQKLLKRLRDSVVENGGLTAEVKALVRELRGEVLGMGREMGRKLDQVGTTSTDRGVEGNDKEELSRIVQEGLAELKDHMQRVVKERRRQSGSSIISKTSIDSGEIRDTVRHAVNELQLQRYGGDENNNSTNATLDKEEILEAIKEGWETYRPEIELQNFGLERDEILQCLKEGLEEYRTHSDRHDGGGLSRQDVLEAVRDGLDHFVPPPVVTLAPEPGITREEILMAVREALETMNIPNANMNQARDIDITRADMVDAVREGLGELNIPRREGPDGDMMTPMEGLGQEVLNRLHEVIEGMRIEFKGVSDEAKQNVAANGRDTEQVLDALKDGLEHLRSAIELYVDRAADVTGKDEIIESMRDGFERVRSDLEASIVDHAGGTSAETLETIKEDIVRLRDAMTLSLQKIASSSHDESLDRLHQSLKDDLERLKTDLEDSMAENHAGSAAEESFEAIKGEIGHLRETIATMILRTGSSSNQDELIEVIRQSMDELRAEMIQKNDRPESIMSGTGEILDALQEGLDTLRTEIEKVRERPVETNVSDEILDTLKDGLAGIKADMDEIHGKVGQAAHERPIDMTASDEILDALKDGVASIRADIDRLQAQQDEARERELNPEDGQVVVADGEGLKRNDIENLEVLIAQLRIKVEALDAEARTVPVPPSSAAPEGVAMKEDLAGLEQQLRDIEAGIASLVDRPISTEGGDSSNNIKREDIEALETLLINTKDKIDEMTPPDPTLTATKDDIDGIQLLVRDTKDAVDEVAGKMESGLARADDITALETLINDVKLSVEELKERVPHDPLNDEPITKTDLDAIEELCMDLKVQLDQIAIPNVDDLPSKSQVDSVSQLIKEQHDKARHDADLTLKAVQEGKLDSAGVMERLSDLKVFLDEMSSEMKDKLDDRSESIEAMGKLLTGLDEIVGSNATVGTDIKEVMEMVSREFERSHGIGEELKTEQDLKVAEILQKMEERFDEILVRYEAGQEILTEAAKVADVRADRNDEVMGGVSKVADELKLTSDTLGMTITEAVDKMAQDSKTVFNRLEDTYSKVDETNMEAKAGFEETNVKFEKTLNVLNELQRGIMTEHHPRVMTSLEDVLGLVRQHYEYSQKRAKETPPPPPPPPAFPEELVAMIRAPPPPPAEKYDDAIIQTKLDTLLSQITSTAGHKDHEVHTKLDQLVNHSLNDPTKSSEQITLLDQIHRQVQTTATEVSAYFATQARLTAEDHEDKLRRAEEASLATDRAILQKSQIETEIANLLDQKDTLRQVVDTLNSERDNLITSKTRLAADVASLETARKLRHEELSTMEVRAEALERRILEGIIDHSRALLISRPSKDLAAENMSLKRVSKRTSSYGLSVSGTTNINGGNDKNNMLTLALKPRPPPIRMNGIGMNGSSSPSQQQQQQGGGRRILSLNQITGNVPTGGNGSGSIGSQGFSYLRPTGIISRTDTGSSIGSGKGLGNLKRSHSVKTGSGAGSLRKSSLGGRGRWDVIPIPTTTTTTSQGGPGDDKENDNDVFVEEDGDGDSYGYGRGSEIRTNEDDGDSLDDDEEDEDGTVTVTTSTDRRTSEAATGTGTNTGSGSGSGSGSRTLGDEDEDGDDRDYRRTSSATYMSGTDTGTTVLSQSVAESGESFESNEYENEGEGEGDSEDGEDEFFEDSSSVQPTPGTEVPPYHPLHHGGGGGGGGGDEGAEVQGQGQQQQQQQQQTRDDNKGGLMIPSTPWFNNPAADSGVGEEPTTADLVGKKFDDEFGGGSRVGR
ncbi:MAG: hypothetical protein M1823_005399 [Watsoniomyces obsoletus]|nr:MAG: hypothetical protein M1823_005399 [Watsoniomyces obsoletus]